MQITLIQVEIEEAIRQYVNQQINVREGMRIDIDLKATRGAEGYQAFIDIVPADSAATDRAESDSQDDNLEPVVVNKLSFASTLSSASPKTEHLQTTVAPQTDITEVPVRRTRGPNKPKGDPTIGSTASDPFNSQSEDAAAEPEYMGRSAEPETDETTEEAEEVAVEDKPAPTEKPRSLFGNLNRPSNG